jgi:hypothetical protein
MKIVVPEVAEIWGSRLRFADLEVGTTFVPVFAHIEGDSCLIVTVDETGRCIDNDTVVVGVIPTLMQKVSDDGFADVGDASRTIHTHLKLDTWVMPVSVQ